MALKRKVFLLPPLALFVYGCATVADQPEIVSSGATSQQQAQAQANVMQLEAPTLKRKVAVGRFSNSTRYGKALLFDAADDPIADQASDILMSDLINSRKFLVLERSDIDVVAAERGLPPSEIRSKLVGVDALIIGSITELGRKTEGKVGFLSSTKKQIVEATVEIRLVDIKTGVAFYSGTGTGAASTEAGEVAGFGSRAGYDATLRDKAIGAAIADLMTNIIRKLDERRWFTDILAVEGGNIIISGGQSQGIKSGDRFVIETIGKTIKSRQTGFDITLPGEPVAEIEVVSMFGDEEFSQGAVTRLVSGSLPARGKLESLKVVEK